MSRDPYRDMRRHLAAEAYEWRKKAMSEAQPRLQAVPEPGATTTASPKPIVVGYDGTAGAVPALTWAVAEARERHVPLIIVRAWQWDEELAEPGLVAPESELEELAHSTLPDWVQDAENVSVVLAPRAAGPAIVGHSVDAALVVVGRRRLGAIQRAWLGSTSAYVVQHAPCPVVVVPETASTADVSADLPATASTGSGSEEPTGSGTPE